MKYPVLLTIALLLGTAPALARQCPLDMAKIDAALKTANLSQTDAAQVRKLRDDGEKFHKAGDHPKAEDALAKAKGILKI